MRFLRLSAILLAALSLPIRAGAVEERVCAGADSLEHVAAAWATLLAREHPEYRVRIEPSKLSADGFQALMDGHIACAPFVRELFASERKAFAAKFGYAPTLVPVAGGSYATPGGTHAIAIYVNAANPLNRITVDQLRGVLSGAIVRWGELGLTGAWTARPIAVYGMVKRRPTGDPPGIVNFMEQRVMAGRGWRADLHEQPDTAAETALPAIVHRIADDAAGIGYSGFGFARAGAKTLAVSDGGDFYAGTPEEVAERRYPLSRTIYVLVNRVLGQPLDPAIAAYLEVALSAEGQGALGADHERFLPLPDKDRAAARAMLR